MSEPFTPIDQRDTIYVPRLESNIVNFNHILKTGQVDRGDAVQGLSIDWHARDADGRPDALNRAVQTIERNAQHRVEQTPELQDLLRQKHWSRNDRVDWEQALDGIVKSETAKIDGLRDYRLGGFDDGTHAYNLNNLSRDIENHTRTQRNDCGPMTLVKGAVMQNLENLNLPATALAPGDYRRAMSYYFVGGKARINDGGFAEPHDFTRTPSGNVIEETAGDHAPSYMKVNGDYTLEGFVRGDGLVTDAGRVYGAGYDTSLPGSKIGKPEFLSRNALLARGSRPGSALLEDAPRGLVAVADETTSKGHTVRSVSLYQERNAGTPDQAYVLVGVGLSGGPAAQRDGHASLEYTDTLDGDRKYKVDADFSDRQVQMDIYRRSPPAEAHWYDFGHAGGDNSGDGYERTAGEKLSLAGDKQLTRAFNAGGTLDTGSRYSARASTASYASTLPDGGSTLAARAALSPVFADAGNPVVAPVMASPAPVARPQAPAPA